MSLACFPKMLYTSPHPDPIHIQSHRGFGALIKKRISKFKKARLSVAGAKFYLDNGGGDKYNELFEPSLNIRSATCISDAVFSS